MRVKGLRVFLCVTEAVHEGYTSGLALPVFSVNIHSKTVKITCFDTLLQLLILKVVVAFEWVR